jgi:hypothetical protein
VSFERELEKGMFASVSTDGGESDVVRTLPLDADLVVLRRPIVGG